MTHIMLVNDRFYVDGKQRPDIEASRYRISVDGAPVYACIEPSIEAGYAFGHALSPAMYDGSNIVITSDIIRYTGKVIIEEVET